MPAGSHRCWKPWRAASISSVGCTHASASNRRSRLLPERLGRRLIDIRQPPPNIPIGTGRKRSGQRLLTVGTDCAWEEVHRAGTDARLQETERRCGFPRDGPDGNHDRGLRYSHRRRSRGFRRWGRGNAQPGCRGTSSGCGRRPGFAVSSLYAGVSLGLLHGTQPDVIVLCHEIGRDYILGAEDYPVPTLEDAIDLNLELGEAHECPGSLRWRFTEHLQTRRSGGAHRLGAIWRTPAAARRRPNPRWRRIREARGRMPWPRESESPS